MIGIMLDTVAWTDRRPITNESQDCIGLGEIFDQTGGGRAITIEIHAWTVTATRRTAS